MKFPEKKMKSSINETDWNLGVREGEVFREAEGEMHAWIMEEQNSLFSHSVEESIAWNGKFKKIVYEDWSNVWFH